MDPFTDLLTNAIHGDAEVREVGNVAPPIHVTTTFNYAANPDELYPAGSGKSPVLLYSREVHQNAIRVEAVLAKLLDGNSVVYSSGHSAFYALLVYLSPKRLFIGEGYHGTHVAAQLYGKNNQLEFHTLDEIEKYAQKGDLVHLETPINPTGEALDMELIAQRTHSTGAIMSVDATFAPPPLMHPFKYGADIIMHSATKYLSGHSDVLAGVLVTKSAETAAQLRDERTTLGTIIPSLESWILLRSLKTFPLRIKQQSHNVNAITKYLSENIERLPKLTKVYSANLQTEAFVKQQLPLGGSPTFAIEVTDEKCARELPSKLKIFYHATSLGSVDSMVEWRPMTDETAPRTLLRFTIGTECTEDLIADLKQALS